MSGNGSSFLNHEHLNVDGILLRADGIPGVITHCSTLSGVGYATDGHSILLVTKDGGHLHLSVDDWSVIREELGWMLEEADRCRRL